MYDCMHVYIRVCIHVCVCNNSNNSVWVCIHVCMYVCIYIYVSMSVECCRCSGTNSQNVGFIVFMVSRFHLKDT